MKLINIIFCLIALSACTDTSGATKALNGHGFSDIKLTGWGGPFACSDSDGTSTGFTAKNAKGDEVSGVVCCGVLLKNCTVRF